MDDTNNIPKQQNPIGGDQPVQNIPQAQAVQPQPDASLIHKEQEPIPSNPFIKASEIEPVVHEELKEFGVNVLGEKPTVSEEAYKAGVRPVGENIPVQTSPSPSSQILTSAQATAGAKSGVGNSLAWLSTLILKIMKPRKKTDTQVSY